MEEDGISLECLSKKDKFHLLRVPKGFDVTQLNGVKYDPDKVLKIEKKKDDSGLVSVYELGTFSSQNMDLNLLIKSDDKVKVGPELKRSLSVTKTVQLDSTEVHFAVTGLQSALSGNVSLPLGLRERFTPFGSNCPTSEEKKNSFTKQKKRKRSSDVSPSPSKKRQRQEDDSKDGNSSHSYSVGSCGDAGSVLTAKPSSDKVKKHKKKKRKSNDSDINGDIDSSQISITPVENGLNSSVDGDSGDYSTVKLDKKKKKHSLHDGTTHAEEDDSLNQTLDESMTKKKRHKEKKKKKKDKD